MESAVRVTTDPDLFEQHADSLELWSLGSQAFPDYSDGDAERSVQENLFRKVLGK